MQIVIHCSLLCTYNSLFVCSYWAFIFFLSLVLSSFLGHLFLFYVLLSLHPTSCLAQFAEAGKKHSKVVHLPEKSAINMI
jgi:hypothetical protein